MGASREGRAYFAFPERTQHAHTNFRPFDISHRRPHFTGWIQSSALHSAAEFAAFYNFD
jgi:hypothetical protein